MSYDSQVLIKAATGGTSCRFYFQRTPLVMHFISSIAHVINCKKDFTSSNSHEKTACETNDTTSHIKDYSGKYPKNLCTRWQDATHITFGVGTIGFRYKNVCSAKPCAELSWKRHSIQKSMAKNLMN
jgi:hypothetical protein